MGKSTCFFAFLFGIGIAAGGEPPSPGRVADREMHRQQERDRIQLQKMRDAQQGSVVHERPFPADGLKTETALDVYKKDENDESCYR